MPSPAALRRMRQGHPGTGGPARPRPLPPVSHGSVNGDLLRRLPDMQGAEGDLVAGGRETLARTRYLYTECFDDELYEGAPTRSALLDMLPDFEVVRLYESDILLRNARLTSA